MAWLRPFRFLDASLFVIAALVACSSHHPAQSERDASVTSEPDAGPVPKPDAGPENDAGTVPDAGASSPDAGKPLKITTLTPPLGSVSGGTNVIVLGSGFSAALTGTGSSASSSTTTVTVGGTVVPFLTGVTIIDDSRMVVVTPPGVPGPANFEIVIGTESSTCTGCFDYIANIVVDSVTPTLGSALGGTPITISGQGFAPGMLVLVGGSEATGVVVSTSGTQIQCVTPPGASGSSDIGVISSDTAGWLRRGYVYYSPIVVSSVTPASSPLAGQGTVTLFGTGFTPDATVSFGSALAATTWVSSTTLSTTVPAASSAGAVTVTVSNAGASGALMGGFAYVDSSTALKIYAVVPSQTPVPGGVGAQVVGSGLLASGVQLAFGGQAAPILGGGANQVTVTIPNHPSAAIVDVTATDTAGASFTLPQAFAYVVPLVVDSIDPPTGPASGTPGVAATLTGTGFSNSCSVEIGAVSATVTGVASDGTTLTVAVPPGSTGAEDVRVSCGSPGSTAFQQTTLPSGFVYTSALSLLTVVPDTGAIAGNTAVTIYGTGFETGMQVKFGAALAPMVDVQSPNIAVLRTPPGSKGYVDVVAQTSLGTSTLTNSFGYYDPTSELGGGSDGPMLGILNVTVINETWGQVGPLEGATISVDSDQLVGTTDSRGQVTFSDPSLLKPVTITGSKLGFTTTSIALIDARDVTLLMSGQPAPCMGSQCSGPPPPAPAIIEGTVCGFKLAPGVVVGTGQHLEARVYLTLPYIYAAPPFGGLPSPLEVKTDCGAFKLQTSSFGSVALWSVFGIASDTTTDFTPVLMGVLRDIATSPGTTVTGQDIILSMHLDQSYPVTIDESQLAATQPVMNHIYSYLDLAGEGVVPLGDMESTAAQFTFANQPDVEGQAVIFVNLASYFDPTTMTPIPPLSFCFQQQYGNLSAGVTVGPMMAFSQWISPMAMDSFTGTLTWEFLPGTMPNVQQLELTDVTAGTGAWSVVLPGDAQSVTMPPSAQALLTAGDEFEWTLFTAVSPRFDYDTFTFDELGINDWTSFTENYGTFLGPTTPLVP